MREDRYTNTPEDAAAYQAAHNDYGPDVDPRDVLDREELGEYMRRELPAKSSLRIVRRAHRRRNY